jgi:hypothetical protein
MLSQLVEIASLRLFFRRIAVLV